MTILLTKEQMAKRVALELEDGYCVNLGIGLPVMVSHYIDSSRVILFQSENGLLGVGPLADEQSADEDLTNAADQEVTAVTGASVFDSLDSFAMIRGGHLDVTVLGGFQVSANGDLANWKLPQRTVGSYGGAMDLAVGAKRVIVMMTHITKDGASKIVNECDYELTAKQCVNTIVTDCAVIEVADQGLILKEVAPGWTPDAVQAITAPKLIMNHVQPFQLA